MGSETVNSARAKIIGVQHERWLAPNLVPLRWKKTREEKSTEITADKKMGGESCWRVSRANQGLKGGKSTQKRSSKPNNKGAHEKLQRGKDEIGPDETGPNRKKNRRRQKQIMAENNVGSKKPPGKPWHPLQLGGKRLGQLKANHGARTSIHHHATAGRTVEARLLRHHPSLKMVRDGRKK